MEKLFYNMLDCVPFIIQKDTIIYYSQFENMISYFPDEDCIGADDIQQFYNL